MLNGYDIVEQARNVIEDYLSLVELLAAIKQFQADNFSPLICRCQTCRRIHSRTLAWVRLMRAGPPPTALLPEAHALTSA